MGEKSGRRRTGKCVEVGVLQVEVEQQQRAK
jgi:hypothetical protein